ncbi:MAG: ATP-binding protein [Desulfocapsaceae bacterium]|nr:ATP-binding protein [Desulfocapsaceae bacterium]
MKRFGQMFMQFLPIDPEKSSDEVNRGESYAHFKRMLFLIMLLIAMVPVAVTAGIGYFQYRNLLLSEEHDQLLWRLDGAQKTIDAFIGGLQSLVKFVAREDRYSALLEKDKLQLLFDRLKEQYDGFVDLGIVDAKGIQRSYVGPYDLEGRDYSNQEWFHEVLIKNVYISNVYLGFRQVPHFVIAVVETIPGTNDYWILRATINADTLQKFVATIQTKATNDMFLVNSAGQLQTSSKSYGAVLSRYDKPTNEDGVALYGESRGNSIFHASSVLKNTPWTLVLTEQDYVHKEEWASFKQRLILIFAGSTLVIVLIISPLVSILTDRIRASDEKQLSLLAEAEHSNKLASIGRLAAGVAHEINNPLAIISQKSGLIEDLLGLTPPFEYSDKMRKTLTGIQDSVVRCKNITHRLLGFARRMEVTIEEIDLNQVVREVITFLENESLHNRIQVQTILEDQLPHIRSDRGQIQQILLNITNNAIDAVVYDGIIQITTVSRSESVQIKIKDNGPGMPPAVLEHIFEPFFTTKAQGKGTGLGLSITYGLIKKLGGSIVVDSTVGEGTIFTINLPYTPPHIEESNHEHNNADTDS